LDSNSVALLNSQCYGAALNVIHSIDGVLCSHINFPSFSND